MDPEKFDKVMLDVLYDEVDDVTRAAAERHMGQSERARRAFEDLRTTKEVADLPLVDPPDGLEVRILEAERTARSERSLAARIGSAVSLLAGYAMRPQVGMAALLLLMLGSSLLLLRARPGAHESVQITERGVPESERESVTIMPAPGAGQPADLEAEASPAHGPIGQHDEPESEPPERAEPSERPSPAPAKRRARGAGADEGLAFPSVTQEQSAREAKAEAERQDRDSTPFNDAMLAFREGRYGEARQRFDEVESSDDPNAATAALFSARATQKTSGCKQATGRFDAVARRYAGSGIAHEALWLAAECRRQMGDTEGAARDYRALLEVPSYKDRAKTALAAMSQQTTSEQSGAASAPPKPAAKPPAATAEEP